jgi:hypothetical protein
MAEIDRLQAQLANLLGTNRPAADYQELKQLRDEQMALCAGLQGRDGEAMKRQRQHLKRLNEFDDTPRK